MGKDSEDTKYGFFLWWSVYHEHFLQCIESNHFMVRLIDLLLRNMIPLASYSLMRKYITSLSASVKLSMCSFRQMELCSASTAKRSSKNVLSGLYYFWNRWPAEMLALLRTQHAVQHPLISSTFRKHGIKYSVLTKISRSFIYCTLKPSTDIRVISCF